MTKTVTLIAVRAVMIKFLVNQLPNLSLIGLDVLCQTAAPSGLALGFTPGRQSGVFRPYLFNSYLLYEPGLLRE